MLKPPSIALQRRSCLGHFSQTEINVFGALTGQSAWEPCVAHWWRWVRYTLPCRQGPKLCAMTWAEVFCCEQPAGS